MRHVVWVSLCRCVCRVGGSSRSSLADWRSLTLPFAAFRSVPVSQARNATPPTNRFKTPVAAINTLQMPAFHTPVTPVAPSATPGRNADGVDAVGAVLGGRGVSKGGAQTREGRECWPGDSHRPSWLSDVFSADADGDAESTGAERLVERRGVCRDDFLPVLTAPARRRSGP